MEAAELLVELVEEGLAALGLVDRGAGQQPIGRVLDPENAGLRVLLAEANADATQHHALALADALEHEGDPVAAEDRRVGDVQVAGLPADPLDREHVQHRRPELPHQLADRHRFGAAGPADHIAGVHQFSASSQRCSSSALMPDGSAKSRSASAICG
jgi:hypothetical protein